MGSIYSELPVTFYLSHLLHLSHLILFSQYRELFSLISFSIIIHKPPTYFHIHFWATIHTRHQSAVIVIADQTTCEELGYILELCATANTCT